MVGVCTVRSGGEGASRRAKVHPVAAGTVASDRRSCVLRLRVVLGRRGCGKHIMEGAGERRRGVDDLESWLPKAGDPNQNLQESEGFLRRWPSDDGSVNISGPDQARRVVDTETPEVANGETTSGLNAKPEGAPAVTAAWLQREGDLAVDS